MASRYRWHALAAGSILAVMAADIARAGESLQVQLDQAKIVRLPDHVATIVVGNPLIADVSIQSGGLMVVTGKGYGRTNLIVLDRAGNVLTERTVQVQGPGEDVVVVYRGNDRESYSCAPKCERRITLGDAAGFFDGALGQAGSRAGQAVGTQMPQPQR